MYQQDYGFDGFEWLVVDDSNQSVFAIERKDVKGNSLIAVMNFTENKHQGYMIPVNQSGNYKEILNSDKLQATQNHQNHNPVDTYKDIFDIFHLIL